MNRNSWNVYLITFSSRFVARLTKFAIRFGLASMMFMLAACQLDLDVKEVKYSTSLKMTKSRAKADGIDPVQFEVLVTNLNVQKPAENIEVKILVNGEEPVAHNITCTRTDFNGISRCEATSSLWSLVFVEADLGEKILISAEKSIAEQSGGALQETSERKEALFYDIYSHMEEAAPGALVGYADTPHSYVEVAITILDADQNPIEGMNPLIRVEGPGASNYECAPSDANGVAICKVYSETPGTYELISETPRLADPLILTFESRTRSCVGIPHADSYEIWGENDTPGWGSCVVSGCHVNYSMSPGGACVADVRVCIPYPTGAANATQTWDAVTAGQWGGCEITSCSLNYTMSGTGMGNSCVANTRPTEPTSLPPNAETAEQTWNGTDWDPPYVTSCHYPYKAVSGACAPLDITPDAFVIPNLTYENLDEVIYSTAITVAGVETYVQAGINGPVGTFIEKQFAGESDWLPFDSLTDVLRNGDQFRLRLISSNQIGTDTTVSYTIGATGPTNWTVKTRDSNPPSDIQISHANNQREFYIGWSIAGISNSPRTCAVEFRKNAGTWDSVASGIDCDTTLAMTPLNLPAAAGFSNFFNTTGVPLRIVRSDGTVLATLAQRLRCFADPYVPSSDDPNRDENCSGNWTDDGDITAPDTTPLAGFFSIVETSPVTHPLIHLNITCPVDLEGSPVLVAFSETNPPTNWEPCGANKSMILTGNGPRDVYVQFKDTSDNLTAVQSQSITYDSTQPTTQGSFVINDGRPFTQTEAVTLKIFCPTDLDAGVIEYALGLTTDPGNPGTPADWSVCASTESYNLTGGDGTKTLHMRFKGDAGTLTDSVQASIVLDKNAPLASISYFDGWQTTSNIAVTASASDSGSGLENCDLQIAQASISNGVVGAFTAWSTVSTACSNKAINGVSGAAYKFRLRATDKAGNTSVWYEPSSVVKINMEQPYGGSISHFNSVQTTTDITVKVNRGLDSYSGMSAAAGDYTLLASYAILDPSTLSCGTYTAYVDAGVVESPTATQYNYTGVQGYCYKFRYQVRNAVGLMQSYTSAEVTKINFTYAWNIGAYGACNGGTGTWSYGGWGACTGGTGVWQYTAWSGCSASCGGGGQSRSASCSVNPNTATELRSATCNKVALSGVQYRTVNCQRSDGATVADSFCAGTKAVAQQSCTPTSDSVCGAVTTSRSCTNYSNTVCGGQAALYQSCNTQPCCQSSGTSNLCPGTTYTMCRQWGNCTSYGANYCVSGSASVVSYGGSCGGWKNTGSYSTCRCN